MERVAPGVPGDPSPMRSLYFPVSAPGPVFDAKTCRVISVRPLLRELILRVAELAALDSRVAAEARLMSVLMDELEDAHVEPLLLPLPADLRALKVAECVLKRPADGVTATALARQRVHRSVQADVQMDAGRDADRAGPTPRMMGRSPSRVAHDGCRVRVAFLTAGNGKRESGTWSIVWFSPETPLMSLDD
jgi:hypothetical protein